MAIFGLFAFMLAALLVIPIMVGVIYAVAFAPIGVALFIPVAFITRKRWVPAMQKRVGGWLATPELDEIIARRNRNPETRNTARRTPLSVRGTRRTLVVRSRR